MPTARQMTLTVVGSYLLVTLSAISASPSVNNNNKLSSRLDGKAPPEQISASASMGDTHMVPMRSRLPLQQQHQQQKKYQQYQQPRQQYLTNAYQPRTSSVGGPNLNQQQSHVSLQTSASHHQAGDLHTAAGHHHKHHKPHGKYYEYREVPHKKAWKFGYKRGNHKHTIERHEHGKGPHFKTKVKWHDKKGKGVHLWDYNHYDKKKKHYG